MHSHIDMQAPDVTLHQASGAASELCDLFQTVFGQPITPEQWRWKYNQAPAQRTLHVLARQPETGELIGHAGLTVLNGFWQCRPIQLAQVTDVMVHPAHRSNLGTDNIYRRMMHTLQQGLHRDPSAQDIIVYGFPGQRPATLGIRMGFYRALPRIEQISLGAALDAGPLYRVTGVWRCRATRLHTPDPEWLDQWASRARHDNPHPHLEKNAAYLLWRYFEHPTHRYQLWALRRRAWGDAGWAITRLDPTPTLIDTCLHPAIASAPGQTALQTLGAALTRVNPGSVWSAWRQPTTNTPEHQLSPIFPVEIAGSQGFHPDRPQLVFHPGDTDVY